MVQRFRLNKWIALAQISRLFRPRRFTYRSFNDNPISAKAFASLLVPIR
jgi:hypothetical protein